MKISFNWLRELVALKPGVTADSVAQQLTLVGLEVESIERRGRDVSGVVVAEVRGSRPHPSADKLTLVRVVAGGGGVAVMPEDADVATVRDTLARLLDEPAHRQSAQDLAASANAMPIPPEVVDVLERLVHTPEIGRSQERG